MTQSMTSLGTPGALAPTTRGRTAASTARAADRAAEHGAPPPPPDPLPGEDGSAALFQTIPNLDTSELDQDALGTLIKQLVGDLLELQLLTEQQVIVTDEKTLEANIQQKIKDIQKRFKDFEKQKHASLAHKIGRWFAQVFSIIVAVVFTVVTLGAGSGPAIAFAVTSLTLTVALTVMDDSGGMEKMVDAISESIADDMIKSGMDPDKARQKAAIIAQAVIAAIIIIAQIACAIGQGGSNIGQIVDEMAQKIAKFALRAAALANVGVQLASTGVDLNVAVVNYQATQDQARQLDNQAFVELLHRLIQSQQDTITKLIEAIDGTHQAVGRMIQEENESEQSIARMSAGRSAV